MFILRSKEFYLSQWQGSEALFNECWQEFEIKNPNCDCDADVIEYLDMVAAEYVNNPDSEFYLYG
jgi:hypothetical protein